MCVDLAVAMSDVIDLAESSDEECLESSAPSTRSCVCQRDDSATIWIFERRLGTLLGAFRRRQSLELCSVGFEMDFRGVSKRAKKGGRDECGET